MPDSSDKIPDSGVLKTTGTDATGWVGEDFKIVAAVEASHAQGLVRRRRMLVRSIEEAAKARFTRSRASSPPRHLERRVGDGPG